MAALHVALHAFRTKHAAVEGEILPRLESDNAILADLELNAALLSTEAAVGFHQLFRSIGLVLPTAGRHIAEMRAVAAGQFVERERGFSHVRHLAFYSAPSKEVSLCRPGTNPANHPAAQSPRNR